MRPASRWPGWCRAAAASCNGKPPPPSRSARESWMSAASTRPCDRARSIASIGLLFVIVARPSALAVALPILGLWFAAPYFAFLLSKPAPSSRPELSDTDRAVLAAARGAHVALLRDLRHGRGPLAAARQRPVRSRAAHCASHLADQHRDDAAVDAVCVRPRPDRCHHPGHTPRRHAHHGRSAGTLRRPSAELVRHPDARAAAAEIHLHGRQRQLRGGAADAVVGPARDCRATAGRGRAAGSAGRSRLRLLRRNAFRVPVRPPATAVRDWLSPRRFDGRGAHGQRVLRPARLRGAAGELRGHRQGRRARDALVPPRPADHRRARLTGAAVVERHDVRVPDAAAGDAQLSGNAARRVVPHGGAPADRLCGHARHAVGDLRERLHGRRSPGQLPVQGVRRAGPWIEARTRRRAGGVAVCDRAGGADRSGTQRAQPAAARRPRHARRARLLRIDRLHRPRRRPALRPTTA